MRDHFPRWWVGKNITMATAGYTPEQIVRKLREADRLLAEARDVADVARHLEVRRRTFVLSQTH